MGICLQSRHYNNVLLGDDQQLHVGQYCWYFGNSGGTTHPWHKEATPGTYDMAVTCGNGATTIFSSYTSASQTNPTALQRKQPLLRGGSWTQDNGLVTSAVRAATPQHPGTTTNRRGFRSVHR